jgi:menaquinone-dependent protoporphyrinogen oxidase
MANILIVYSTTDGHTRNIGLRLKQVIEQQDHRVTLISIADRDNIAMEAFDKIVIGASIRYGKHGKRVNGLIMRNKHILESKPSAFFSVNLVARKPEKSQPETNPYLRKFLTQISWQPKVLAVFAGKIDYQKYRFWERQIIRLIMLVTKGPINPKTAIDFTNWNQVEAFGKRVSDM